MYKRRIKSIEGCRIFFDIFGEEKWAFIKYIFYYVVINIASILLIYTACLMTCCIGFFILNIPYVWAVVTLPLLIFFRLFGMEFISQFGDEFNLFPVNSENAEEITLKPENLPPEDDYRLEYT